jgi:phage shock protein PspC (stress-responsive transcriptional regulator)
MKRKLCRSKDERMIWGICGGLGKHFDMDPTIFRIIAVLTILISLLGPLLYLILRFVIPLEPVPEA